MSPVHEFLIGLTRSPGRVVVTVCGDMDATTNIRLGSALDDLVDQNLDLDLVVDMAGVTFLDSGGIYVLIRALKRARSSGRQFTLSGVNPGAYKVLDVCGFTGVFEVPSPSAGSSY